MKKQLWNQGWTLNETEVVDLPRDEMVLTTRSADSPVTDAQGFFQPGKYTYTKKLGVDAKYAFVNFDGVYRNAHVYLNEEEKAFVPYGYIPFLVELGEVKKEDVLKVECDNLDQPDSRWYSGAGIYRDVHLFTSDEDFIYPRGIKVDTLDYKTGEIRVRVHTSAQEPTVEILENDTVVASGKGNDLTFTIADAKLWDDENPNLYTCKVTLGNDVVEERFGIRQIEKQSNGISVNGKNVLLKGGCIHHDNGLLGSATYEKSEYRRVKILKDAGFNALRSAHNPASEALLKVCDELGMYVMDETWDMWFFHKNKNDYATYWDDYHMSDIEKLVERDYNHPSVILYSIGNEVSEPGTEKGLAATKEMVAKFHELDPNRLVTGGFNLMIITSAANGKGIYKEEGGMNNDTSKLSKMNSTMFNMIVYFVGSGMNKAANSKKADEICSPSLDALDIAGYNYASGRYPLDETLHPNRIVFGSETMPYDIAKNWALVEKHKNVVGDFMWTAWDYMGENGIGAWAYSNDAKSFSKPYPWWLADTGAFDIIGTPNAEAAWAMATWKSTDKPLICVRPINHEGKVIRAAWRGTNGIPSYSWRNCQGRKAEVEVFFHGKKVDLYQNGRKVKSAPIKENRAYFKVRYQPGELEAIVYDISGNEIGRNKLFSAESEVGVVLHAEEECVKVNDLVYVNVNMEDAKGVVESNADRAVTIQVENGELLAFGSANPRMIEDIHCGTYSTYYGRALAIIKATKPGTINVTSEGKSVSIKVVE